MDGGIRKRGNKWRVEVYVGRDATGKKRYLSGTTSTKDEARVLRLKLLTEAGRGMVSVDGTTVRELMESWLLLMADNLAPNTHEDYTRYARLYIYPGIGDQLVRKVTASDLDALYKQLRGRLSAASVRRVHTLIHGALKQAVKWGWLTENPARNASPPRLAKPKLTVPEQPVIEKLMALAEEENPDLATFIRVGALVGSRRGEILALRRSDVDLEKGQLAIRRKLIVTCERGVEEVDGTKQGLGRLLSLDPGTVDALTALFIRQDLRRDWPDNGYVFSDNGEKPWHPNVISRDFARLRDKAGAKGVRLHDLRHYMATTLLDAGFSVHVVAERLGHTSPKTTLDVYTHFIPGADRQAAEHLGKLFR